MNCVYCDRPTDDGCDEHDACRERSIEDGALRIEVVSVPSIFAAYLAMTPTGAALGLEPCCLCDWWDHDCPMHPDTR